MKVFTHTIYLILFSVFILSSCSSGSLTDEQAIAIYRAEAKYPKEGKISIRDSRVTGQELNRLVEAGFLTKDSNGNFSASKKHDNFMDFRWNSVYKHVDLFDIYSYAVDVATVSGRRSIDNNTLEIVFELKLNETPEFTEFRKTVPSLAERRGYEGVYFPSEGLAGETYTPGKVILRKAVFKKWEREWRIASRSYE